MPVRPSRDVLESRTRQELESAPNAKRRRKDEDPRAGVAQMLERAGDPQSRGETALVLAAESEQVLAFLGFVGGGEYQRELVSMEMPFVRLGRFSRVLLRVSCVLLGVGRRAEGKKDRKNDARCAHGSAPPRHRKRCQGAFWIVFRFKSSVFSPWRRQAFAIAAECWGFDASSDDFRVVTLTSTMLCPFGGSFQ
jgi:hypothetical protein